MNIKSSFFDFFTTSYKERTHSEIMSWILSGTCTAITEESRIYLVNKLFNVYISNIDKVTTEYNHIDVLISTRTLNIAVENKITSTLHSNQLVRYQEKLKELNKTSKCFLFSFINEQPLDKNWIAISYEFYLEVLQELKLADGLDKFFLIGYIDHLSYLVTTKAEFLNNVNTYAFVFKDGSKKKSDKHWADYVDNTALFIAKNQLETCFQLCFLFSLCEDLRTKNVCHFTETRGNALVDIHFTNRVIDKTRGKYDVFLQIQGRNIKFAFSSTKYETSKRSAISNEIKIMQQLQSQNDFGYSKINGPKSKAYVSMSKKMPKAYWEMDKKEFERYIENEVKNVHLLVDSLVSKM